MPFKKIIDSNLVFGIIIGSFILSLAFITCYRGGKDLKVFLFGAEATLQKKSPYENPTDPNRTIYRYAPGYAILQYPFLLKSKVIAPYEFKDITPSVFLWYWVKILSLLISALILLKLIPSPSKEISIRNLKIGILLAIPLIGYELTNSQNKLIALFFMLASLFLFEKNRLFVSAIFFNLALTVYIALLPFVFYFIFRKKLKFIISFILAALIVFIIVPSLIFGIRFNSYLLKEWFTRALKPFFFTNSYATYIDLRDSNQALPGAIGRIFVTGKTESFKYMISPVFIHIIIRALSAIIVLFSCLAVWKRQKPISQGLAYSIFLILALILPLYCIYYTWSWLFVFYFAVLNYISYPEVSPVHKRFLLTLIYILFISSCSIGIDVFNYFSVIFWATFVLWLGMVIVLIQRASPAN